MGNIVFEFTPKQIVFEMAMPVVNVSQTTLFSTLKDVLLTNLANDDMIVYSISALKFINQVKDYYTKTALEAKDFRGITSENIASWNGKQPALGFTPENSANKDQAGGYVGLDPDGKINPNQLPAIAITDTFPVDSEAEMLALTAEKGDVCIRNDENKTYILRGTDPSVLGNRTLMKIPTDLVTSVFGRTGAVTAQSGDYTADQINETSTRKFVSPTEKTAWNIGAISLSLDGQGNTITTGSKGFATIPSAGTVAKRYITADVAGSISIDIKRNGTSIIGAGNKITLSSAQRANAVPTDRSSVVLSAYDELEIVVESASVLTKIDLFIFVTKS